MIEHFLIISASSKFKANSENQNDLMKTVKNRYIANSFSAGLTYATSYEFINSRSNKPTTFNHLLMNCFRFAMPLKTLF